MSKISKRRLNIKRSDNLGFHRSVSYIGNAMIKTFFTYLVSQLTVLLVLCFIASLICCGDADSLKGKSNEDFASLICSLLDRHESSAGNSLGSKTKDCSCVCHVPTLTANSIALSYCPPHQEIIPAANFTTTSAPTRIILRPPIAA